MECLGYVEEDLFNSSGGVESINQDSKIYMEHCTT